MRVVIDTNVFVSTVLGGALAELLDRWQSGQFTLVVTDDIVREYLEVLRRPKFALPAELVDTIIGYVFHKAEFVIPTESLTVVDADPKDNKFLEAAVAGDAELIVGGDRHLLDVRAYRQTPIVTARDFLNRLQGDAAE